MCSILPTKPFCSIPPLVFDSLYSNHCHPISPLCKTYTHLGFRSAYKFSLHNQGRRVEYHTNASVRHRIRVCVRQAQEFGCRDMPAETSEGAQSVRLEKLVENDSEINSSARDFLVVTFYKFVRIEDPEGEVAKHRSFLQGRDIHGRIYMSQQGINAQYSGPSLDALAYAKWVKEDARFDDILAQISPSSGHAFPKLKLRHKFSLLQVDGGVYHLPLLDPSMRAMPLSSSEWKKRLNVTNSSEIEFDGITNTEITNKDQRRKLLLLDVRNGYEWDIGHFQGAKRPDVDCFRSTTFGISDSEKKISDPLAGVDKASTDIMMYCTGGIRCDVYSVILRSCQECVQEFKGCCSTICTSAPRLRPVLYDAQPYERWHIYRDSRCSTQDVGQNNK